MVLDLKPALVSSQYDISLIPNILQLRILSNCEHSPIPNITLKVIGNRRGDGKRERGWEEGKRTMEDVTGNRKGDRKQERGDEK